MQSETSELETNIDSSCLESKSSSTSLHASHVDVNKEISNRIKLGINIIVTIFCAAVYIIPIRSSNAPVLDELFIFDTRGDDLDGQNIIDNADVMGTSNISDLFQSDYWGKNVFRMDSHRSWRPLCVLTFRFLNSLKESQAGIFRGLEDVFSVKTMFVHRLVNIIIHSLLSDLVARAGLALFPPKQTPYHPLMQFVLTKLFFALHPTHVEAVANAANRNHLLAVVASVYCCFGLYCSFEVVVIATISGLLCSEAFVFQIPAITMTTALVWQRKNNFEYIENKDQLERVIKSALEEYFPQILPPIAFTMIYLILRYHYDTLAIYEGLIRPAENPFYPFTGWKRMINYSYVFAVHVYKGFGFDPIGFSHEYGYNCVPEIESLYDSRLLLPLSLFFFIVIALTLSMRRTFHDDFDWIIKVFFCFSWMSTLLPITGIIRIGTFIADRMVVPFTFAVTILAGSMVTEWVLPSKFPEDSSNFFKKDPKTSGRFYQLFLVFLLMTMRLMNRTEDWMSSLSLLESSLETCPRYAKVNLELSKVYSGTVPGMMDLEKSLKYAEEAEKIDPDYCLVHYQFTHIYFYQQEYFSMEERLVKAMLCSASFEKAKHIWNQYWPIVTDPKGGTSAQHAAMRYKKYDAIVQKKFKEEREEQEALFGASKPDDRATSGPASEFEL